MPIIQHDELTIHEVPRIKTRIVANDQNGAEATSVWEQWIHPDGYIPPHYHDVEEVIVILEGDVEVTLADETTIARAPSTLLIPALQVHSLRAHGTSEVHLIAFFPDASPRIFATDGSERPMPWEDRDG